ncbi:MAG: Flp family type IVb pilin [Thermomicrobium sp.]|nr:Flp family type IVb pilin [Thermomicrobium sp.]
MRYLYDLLAWYEGQKQRALEGQGMVEYALIIALVSIAAIAVLVLIGDEIVNVFQQVVDALTGAGS